MMVALCAQMTDRTESEFRARGRATTTEALRRRALPIRAHGAIVGAPAGRRPPLKLTGCRPQWRPD
jgi:hypothetical protein